MFQSSLQVRRPAWYIGGLVVSDEDTIIVGKLAISEMTKICLDIAQFLRNEILHSSFYFLE